MLLVARRNAGLALSGTADICPNPVILGQKADFLAWNPACPALDRICEFFILANG
jgi:hypothetical protein